MDIRIEKAMKRDAGEIVSLQKEAFASEDAYRHSLSTPPLRQTEEEIIKQFRKKTFFKAVTPEGRIVGSVRASRDRNLETTHIEKLMVHPGHRRRGIGKMLMKTIEDHYRERVKRFRLSTDGTNPRNIEFYKSLGYSVYWTRRAADDVVFAYMEKFV